MMQRRIALNVVVAAIFVLFSTQAFRAQSFDCRVWSTTSMMWEARAALRQARANAVVPTKADCLALGVRLAARIGLLSDSGDAFCRCVCDAEFDLPQPGWQLLPGAARDVAARGTEAWVIGTNPIPGGFGIFRWSGAAWTAMPGGALVIAIDEAMQPWIVNDRGGIYRGGAGAANWQQMPGAALEIGAGRGGAWIVGTAPANGGFGIYRWASAGWASFPGAGVRVAVDENGAPWVVNDRSNVYRWTGSGWSAMPGAAVDISAGPGGVWMVGTNPVPGGFGIYRWNGANWAAMPGGAVRIAVGNEAWVVTDQNQVWVWR